MVKCTPQQKEYFASSDPHHGIQFIPFDILSGISIWHSIWHIFRHSFCHIFWHFIWHIFWHSIWHSIWHIFWHSIWHSIRNIFWHSIRHSIWHSLWHSLWLCLWPWRSGWSPARPTLLRLSPVEVRRGPQRSDSRRLKSGEAQAHCDQELADEFRRGPLRSRAGRWVPARPTAIKSWQMGSGEDHCDQELAEEVRRRPLRSRAGRWGPATTTAIKSWQMRSGDDHCDQELADEVRRGWRKRRTTRRRSRASDIKSSNPHRAGGEKQSFCWQISRIQHDCWTDFCLNGLLEGIFFTENHVFCLPSVIGCPEENPWNQSSESKWVPNIWDHMPYQFCWLYSLNRLYCENKKNPKEVGGIYHIPHFSRTQSWIWEQTITICLYRPLLLISDISVSGRWNNHDLLESDRTPSRGYIHHIEHDSVSSAKKQQPTKNCDIHI